VDHTPVSDGREKITVVPGPSGQSIRLHRGNGRLPPIDLSKPFAKKCRNRECNNLGGQPGKPRSIYCSKRCQSREQNLRQGRIKNVRSPTTVAQPLNRNEQGSSRSRSVSPQSSLESDKEDYSSPEIDTKSPSVSPVPFGLSPVPFTSNSPTQNLSTPSPVPLPFSNAHMPPTNILAPSPLNMRLGMTPSPISMSPLPMLGHASGFSPVQMSASTPIYLPKPSAVKDFTNPQKQEKNPPQQNRPKNDDKSHLTLAPIFT